MASLPYDAHVHTSFALGSSSPEEVVRAAEAASLRCVGLGDVCDVQTSPDEIARRMEHARRLNARSPVLVVGALEAIILDPDGALTVSQEDATGVTMVFAGIGERTRGIGDEPPANPRRYADNVLAATCNAAENPLVDVIAHPFNLGRFEAVLTPGQFAGHNVRRVALTLFEHNVAFEISNQAYASYPQMTVQEFTQEYVRLLRVFSEEGVKFVVSSEAQCAGAVGNLRFCRVLMNEAGIELSQLVDLERMARVRDR